MERIMMRTENELTMRNLRNLNQELQAQVKEVGGGDQEEQLTALLIHVFHAKQDGTQSA